MNKREKVEAYILELMQQFDKFGKSDNVGRYKKLFSSLSNKDFENYMIALKEGKTQISVIAPNNETKMTTNDIVALAKKRNVPIFSKVFLHDPHTGRKYLTKYPMMILHLPVRRLSQYLFHKISLPDGDSHVNPVTGQVIPPDKGAALSSIETQILASKGLKTSIVELLKMRSGDMNAYRAMKYTIEEDGEVSLKNIPLTGQPRSVITATRYFHSMMMDISL